MTAILPITLLDGSAARRADERRFRILVAVVFLLAVIPGLIIPALDLPEPERQKLETLPPQLAKLIPEPPPPPPPPEPEPPKPEEVKPKKTPEPVKPKAEREPKKVVDKPVRQVKTVEEAREVASNAGLLAMQDDMAALRESTSVDDLSAPAMVDGDVVVETIAPSTDYGARALVRSGGVKTAPIGSTTASVALEKRRKIDAPKGKAAAEMADADAAEGTSKGQRQRGGASISRVFDQNKASLFSLYNRALRNSPGLQGKLVLELVIEPNGSVSSCKVVSSQLSDPDLEKKIVSRVRLFNFGAQPVPRQTFRYPIDFMPP